MKAFIDEHRERFGVEPICQQLQVAPSAYRRHAARQPDRNTLIHHSDRGAQYVSIRYSERLGEAGIEPSVGSKGDSYDNALAETPS